MKNNVFAILIMFACGVGIAQTQPQPANPDSALLVILSELRGESLSLREAVNHALENSASVRSAEAAYWAARGAMRRERGFFDPELFFNYNYEDLQEPTASFFSGAPTLISKQGTASSGLRWDLPFGTELEASINVLRLRTNSSFAFLNPQYTTFGNISFRQPLLGGFRASARKLLSRSEQQMYAAQARYDQEALAIHAEVESGYWDLYATERDYAVRKLTLEQAEAFLRETQLRATAGLIGPNQVANARTFLAEQKLLLLDREEELDAWSDRLASLIGVRPEENSTRFITIDDPPSEFPLQRVEELIEYSQENNLDLRAARSDIEASRALAKAAGWEMLPSIDLIGSLGGNGLGGSPQEVIFGEDTLRTTAGGSFGGALRQISEREFKTWSVGVEVSIPIGFRSGLGERERLKSEVILSEQRYIALQRLLEEQIRTSYRELFHGKRRIEAAREGVEAAQEQVRIGLIEFQNGRTTAFELVRLGADFAAAQQRYSQALVRTAKAAANLKRLTSGKYPGGASN